MVKVLDVGCGMNKTPGAIGLDGNPRVNPDVLHDLGTFPYPFADDEFDRVIATHVVEHVPDVMGFVTELYRITKNGGTLLLATPHYSNPDWATDLTHRNHFNSYSFNTFVDGRSDFAFYSDARLVPVRWYVTLANLWRLLGIQYLVNLDHKYYGLRFTRKFWEQYLSFILRGKDLQFEFTVKKGDTDDA